MYSNVKGMSKIIFFEVQEWEKEFLEKAFGERAVLTDKTLDATNVLEYKDIEIASCFRNSTFNKQVLDQLPHLKYITARATGFDQIDIAYCTEKGIVVSNVPAYGVHTVAEHAFTLMLALAKKLIPSIERTRKGDFSLKDLMGIDLNTKTLGIVGAGKIGTAVIHIARCFGMHILILKHHDEISENSNIEYVDLPTLLKRSDFVTLHLPLTQQTKHIINKQNIKEFKKGSYLINTARGGLIETEAILDGLESGILAGVGLDVLEDEKMISEEGELLSNKPLHEHPSGTERIEMELLKRDDVLITPHKAFYTQEAVHELLEVTKENIEKFEKGEPQNVVES